MPFGSPHCHYAECASTNALARVWALDANAPAPHGALVSADFQTRGRGRRGRQWLAGRGESVLMSVVLRPAFAQSEAWQIAFVAALAVSDAVGIYVPHVAVKWPNDALINGNKVSGVLVETVPAGASGWAAIVGIGVNVSQTEFDPNTTYQVPPTSLRLAGGQVPTVSVLTAQIAHALELRLAQHARQGWEDIRADWRSRMAEGIVLERGHEQGLLLNLEADGRARVRLPSGTFARWATVDAEESTNTSPNQV